MTVDASAAQSEPVALRVRVRPWMAVAVLIATLAMAVAGYGLAKSLPASQVASVDLLVLPNQQGSVDEALVRTFENLLAADVFAARIQESATIAEVQQLTAAEVAASISTARSPTSSLIEVVVTRPDESTALAIAQMISPTVDEVLTVGGVNASEFYQQIFPEPFVREQASISASLTTAIGGFLGFLVGILGVLVWSLRRPVVTTVADIEDLSGYPIIARLPARTAWWRRQQPNILDPLAAAVSQVQSTGLTSEGGVVAVVSPEVETGARFAIEFSALLAQGSDHPVFLVDGDYRRAELTGRLGADHVEGWDRLELTNGPTVTGLSAEVLGSFPPVSSELSGDGGAQATFVPVARLDVAQDRITVTQLGRVLDVLASSGVAVVVCPPVPGDVPAAPAIAAASAVLIVAGIGTTSPDEIGLVGEMVAALSSAPAGVVVVGSGSG